MEINRQTVCYDLVKQGLKNGLTVAVLVSLIGLNLNMGTLIRCLSKSNATANLLTQLLQDVPLPFHKHQQRLMDDGRLMQEKLQLTTRSADAMNNLCQSHIKNWTSCKLKHVNGSDDPVIVISLCKYFADSSQLNLYVDQRLFKSYNTSQVTEIKTWLRECFYHRCPRVSTTGKRCDSIAFFKTHQLCYSKAGDIVFLRLGDILLARNDAIDVIDFIIN